MNGNGNGHQPSYEEIQALATNTEVARWQEESLGLSNQVARQQAGLQYADLLVAQLSGVIQQQWGLIKEQSQLITEQHRSMAEQNRANFKCQADIIVQMQREFDASAERRAEFELRMREQNRPRGLLGWLFG